MTLFKDMVLAGRIAWRDVRGGGARALVLLAAGVLIGVAAVAVVGSASTGLRDAARAGAFEAVGGDLSLRLFHRQPTADELRALRHEGDVSVTAELRPMARVLSAATGQTSAPLLVELKGVDRNYPLYGAVQTYPTLPLYDTLNQSGGIYGAAADPALFDALGAQLGDTLMIGGARYQLRSVLEHEPDRAFRAFALGPRVMVLSESFPKISTLGPGSEVYYYARIKLPEGRNTPDHARAALARIDQAFPHAGWRMVNAHEGVPGVERTLAMAHVLLGAIGLGVLLIGGAGISRAMRVHINAKMELAAILKSIGTPPRVVTAALGVQAMLAAIVGALAGAAVGAGGPWLVNALLAEHVPVVVDVVPAAKPLVAAVVFGVLVAALFAWWPLLGVREIGARVLLRERHDHVPVRPTKAMWVGTALLVGALGAVVFWASPLPVLSGAFLLCALVLAGLYWMVGRGIAALARVWARGRSAHIRLALGNLCRPGAPTAAVVMALGLTLTVLVALEGISAAARGHAESVLPSRAPDFVAFSLRHETALHLSTEGIRAGLIERQRTLPFLHARIQAIKGVPVRDLKIPRALHWVVRGDRGVSFSHTPPEGGDVVAGRWWTDMEAAGVAFSLDVEVARKLGLKIGDEISLNVLGRVVSGPIKTLRKVDWTGLDLDFPIVATPGALQGLPHTYVATLKAPAGGVDALENFLKARYPDVPVIRVADVLAALSTALEGVVAGLRAAAWMCALAALVVLAGAILQGRVQRMDEVALFKVLGARRAQLLRQLTAEFALLGVLVALVAVPIGLGVALLAAHAAGLPSTDVPWRGALAWAGLAVGVTVVVGVAVMVRAYAAAPARVLRRRGV